MVPLVPIKGHVYTTINKIRKSWSLNFDVNPKKKTECMTSLLHYTTGSDTGPGTRVPAIFMYPETTALYICFPINGQRFCRNTTSELSIGQWHHVTIEHLYADQESYDFKISVDGTQVFSVKNNQPVEYLNVKGYISDAWFPPAKAFIENVDHKSFKVGK